MNFTPVKHFLFNNLHTILFLLGLLLIVVAIGFLTNIYYFMLALGLVLILIALLLDRGEV